MTKRKRKERIMSEPSTQLFITEFMEEGEKSREIILEELPKIKLEPAEKKIKRELEEKEKDKN